MYQTNLISVIVPVYNTAKYLSNCIESILSQSYIYIEIILVNDGSTDESGTICDEFTQKDQCIKVIHQENQGASAARNAGLSLASGEYITFVDSDDTLPREAIEFLVDGTKKTGGDLIIGDCIVVGNQKLGSYWQMEHDVYSNMDFCVEMVVNKNIGWLANVVWGKLFRNSVIRENDIKFDNNLVCCEDSVFMLDYLSHTCKITNIKFPVYNFSRYEETERISASTVIYYDALIFYYGHAKNLWNMAGSYISGNTKILFCSNIIDQLIIYMVHAAAYQNYFNTGELRGILKTIVNDDVIGDLSKYYARKNPSYSILIPFFIKNKFHICLYYALKHRSKKYLKVRGNASKVKSIYRDGSCRI